MRIACRGGKVTGFRYLALGAARSASVASGLPLKALRPSVSVDAPPEVAGDPDAVAFAAGQMLDHCSQSADEAA